MNSDAALEASSTGTTPGPDTWEEGWERSPSRVPASPVPGRDGAARRPPLERRADWLVVAARLVLLRSRLLFPDTPAAAAAAERDATTELKRLDAVRATRDVAAWLEARPQLGPDCFARPGAPSPRTESYKGLMEACLVVMRGRARAEEFVEVYRPEVPFLWSIEEAIARFRRVLASHPGGAELRAFEPTLTGASSATQNAVRAGTASTLIAGLELARQGTCRLTQSMAFSEVHVLSVVSERREHLDLLQSS